MISPALCHLFMCPDYLGVLICILLPECQVSIDKCTEKQTCKNLNNAIVYHIYT